MTNPHLIRLRGAWQWRPREDEAEAPRRVDLPTTWPAAFTGPLLLTRHFRRPRLDAGRQQLRLRLEAVAGLRSVRLNGSELARPAAGTTAVELDVHGDLLDRNVLVLEVDPASWSSPGNEPDPWGVIALVIDPA